MSIFGTSTDQTVKQAADVFQRTIHSFFNAHSFVVFIVSIGVALIIGRIIAHLLRIVVKLIGRRADKSQNLRTVNRLRRYETSIVLSIAIIRVMLVILATYFWWMYAHPSSKPTAIIGASAVLAIVLSGALVPILRDLANGSIMMAEQWYGVGDYVKFEPFWDIEGVVDRVTLRSTRIKALNGESVWMSNQYITGVHVTTKGTRTFALELFVDDAEAGEQLIKKTNKRLPIGPLLVVTPLTVVSNEQVGDNLWHITAVCETAPGREWLIEKSAVELMKWLDEQNKKQVIAHGPLARYADTEAERSFKRTINNARKRPTPRRINKIAAVKSAPSSRTLE